MKITIPILAIIISIFFTSCFKNVNSSMEEVTPSFPSYDIAIPAAGNSWVLKNGDYISTDMITSEGIRNWKNADETIRTFFYIEKPGKISLGVRSKVSTGTSRVKVYFGNESRVITLSGDTYNEVLLGDFPVDSPGYYYLDIQGLAKEGTTFADIDDVLIGGIESEELKFIRDDFYFGRRGPSVHLRFKVPEDIDQVEWFYSELKVPENQDVIGSYFMANGFGEGYFGIQVNSPTERRILFSIWSPYQTDNPDDVPEEYKIILLKKGEGVTTGKFGNEGSGGQSYKVFDWESGVSYGFLIGAKPASDNHTDYVAYFFDPEVNKWNLIAEFRRPKTNTYVTNLYSFLENFIPHQGVYERRGLYQNQWVYSHGDWYELTDAIFTVDNTARKEYRLDHSGGLEGEGFYLKNCGFTNDKVTMQSEFKRERSGRKPKIDFSSLK